jgi:heptosyltransferase I
MTIRIAVFRLSALGDCVMVLPAIRALQETLPEVKITWIIEHNLLPLFENINDIEFLPIKKPHSFKDYLVLKKQLSAYEFDVLLAMQASMRSNFIYPLINAKRKIGFDTIRGKELHGLFINERIPSSKEHLLDGFMAFADTLINTMGKVNITKLPSWNLKLSQTDITWCEAQFSKLNGKIIAINPAASKLERCCSPEFYSELIVKIAKQYSCSIVLTGGPSTWEVELAAKIQKLTLHKRQQEQINCDIVNLVARTSLQQLSAVLSKVDVLIAPDTGPIHLADALGTTVIGLYAVASPALTGPYQNQSLVINKYSQALNLINEDIGTVKWGKRVHHPKAMSFFKTEEIMEKLSKVFASSP